MERVEKIYILAITLTILSVVFFCVSYAFFTDTDEEHGKLNIVAGDLKYKFESDKLNDNKITIAGNSIQKITIKLTSLNDIDSKYQLYYQLNAQNEDITIGYDKDSLYKPEGKIEANSSKIITVIIRNSGDTSSEVSFDFISGLVNSDLVLSTGNSFNKQIGEYFPYSVGQAITLSDNSKWHVLSDSDEYQENVVLLSDYNLNNDGTYDTDCGININSNPICSPMIFDGDNTNVYDSTDSNNIGYFIKNTYESIINSSLSGITSIGLPTVYDIVLADNQQFNNFYIKLNNNWLTTTSYWTMTAKADTTDLLWSIQGESGNIYDYYPNTNDIYGVRVKITSIKSNIVR